MRPSAAPREAIEKAAEAAFASEFIARFTRDADPRILFPGAIYGEGYRELLAHAHAYIHATEVGGTHPALVEAMGYGNCVVVHDTPENVEVAGLRRFKDDVTEVRDGFECGINLGSHNDLQLGDLISTYEMREKPRA